jgi:hypothetical protein
MPYQDALARVIDEVIEPGAAGVEPAPMSPAETQLRKC